MDYNNKEDEKNHYNVLHEEKKEIISSYKYLLQHFKSNLYKFLYSFYLIDIIKIQC